MIRDLQMRPFLHERSPDAPEVIVSTPLRFIAVDQPDCHFDLKRGVVWTDAKARAA
jgi:hypothetical protein